MKSVTVLIILVALFPIQMIQGAGEFRGVKLTNVDSDVLFTDESIAEAMDYLASIGINAVMPVVWNGTGADGDHTLYPSDVMDELFGRRIHPQFASGRDPLKRVVIEAHRNGIEVYPWFEMGFSSSYSQDGGYIIATYPSWASQNADGSLTVKNGFDWMSGINPEVQKFIISLVCEVLDNYDVDGIEFSDRIPALPVEGGYDLVTSSIYADEHNGSMPPPNHLDRAWMRWRADKLNQFNKAVRDSVKARGQHLLFSSSPSVYPWSYEEYLQDSETWVKNDIVDNIIPQLYRYDISSYIFELNKSLNYMPSAKRNIFYSGMLIKVGDYFISPDFLLKSIVANRDRKVDGEVFFFYEGLRDNNNQLGDTLKATYYSQPALLPHRNGQLWRPAALIVNETDADATISGTWETGTGLGYQSSATLIKKSALYAAVHYNFDIPVNGWYDVYAYLVIQPQATTLAPFTIYSEDDSTTVQMNQRDSGNAGWQFIKSVYLSQGRQTVLKVDNYGLAAGQHLTADAAMIMINRKLSPDVQFIPVEWDGHDNISGITPDAFELYQNYPNPFNAMTRVSFQLFQPVVVKLIVYDVTGRMVDVLLEEWMNAGNHSIALTAEGWNSGLYMYELQVGAQRQTKKLVLLK